MNNIRETHMLKLMAVTGTAQVRNGQARLADRPMPELQKSGRCVMAAARKIRFALSRDGEAGQNYFCPGLELFFTRSRHAMKTMAKLLHDGRPPSDVMAITASEDRRRALTRPRSCGSGRKVQFCHGNNAPRPSSDGAKRERGGTPHDAQNRTRKCRVMREPCGAVTGAVTLAAAVLYGD